MIVLYRLYRFRRDVGFGRRQSLRQAIDSLARIRESDRIARERMLFVDSR